MQERKSSRRKNCSYYRYLYLLFDTSSQIFINYKNYACLLWPINLQMLLYRIYNIKNSDILKISREVS